MKNRLPALLLVLCMLCTLLPLGALAAEIVDSGTLGEELTWTLDSDGKLTVSGSGAMPTGAFGKRTDIVSVEFDGSITDIGSCAFYGCSGLSSLTIPESVKNIGDNAFNGCSSLKGVTIPDSVTKIAYSAFQGCRSLRSVTVPDSVQSIGDSLFRDCSGLESAVLGRGADTVGASMFEDCTSLTSVTIPKGVAGIADSAFKGCGVLENVTLPKGVTSIGSEAFALCSRLLSAKFEGNAPDEFAQNAFRDTASGFKLLAPDGNGTWKGKAYDAGAGTWNSYPIEFYIPTHTNDEHSYTAVVTRPTCTEQGYTTYTCICGVSYRDNYVAALGHDYKDGKCTRCGADDPNYQPPHEHSYSSVVTRPTCTEQGYTTHTCACGDSYIDSYVAALGHDYKDGKCTRCGADDPNYQPPHGHSYSSVVTKPTCTEQGYTTHTCACGVSFVDSYVAALGHDYKDGKCTRCGADDPGYQPPHVHACTSIVTKPSCTEQGYTTHTCACGLSFVDSYVAALGHDFKDGKCTRCGADDPNYEPAHVHSFKDGKCTGCGELSPEPAKFVDVPKGVNYYDAVMWAGDEGITSGFTPTEFRPKQDCTRAQVVTFLWRAAGEPTPKNAGNPFSDVSAKQANGKDNPYYTAILWAAEEGITTGYPGGLFKPNDTVTRAQFVTFLWRFEGKPETIGSIGGFADAGLIASPYQQAVAWAVEKGITTGYNDNTFRPNAACTRWAVVLFMYRDLK